MWWNQFKAGFEQTQLLVSPDWDTLSALGALGVLAKIAVCAFICAMLFGVMDKLLLTLRKSGK